MKNSPKQKHKKSLYISKQKSFLNSVSYLDLSKVPKLKFSLFYILISSLTTISLYLIELKFFSLSEFEFSKSVGITLFFSFCYLFLRIILMQKEFLFQAQIQIFLSFLSFVFNFMLVYHLTESFTKNLPFFGFLLAYNLHILNIAIITKILVKQ